MGSRCPRRNGSATTARWPEGDKLRLWAGQMKGFNATAMWYCREAMKQPHSPLREARARRRLAVAGVSLLLPLLAGCDAGVRYPDYSNTPSPLYGGRPCPASATSRSGGVATPWDCTVSRDT